MAVGGTWVNGVLEVDAFADGVAFDDLVAHFDGGVLVDKRNDNEGDEG